jgi:hypothetical protein
MLFPASIEVVPLGWSSAFRRGALLLVRWKSKRVTTQNEIKRIGDDLAFLSYHDSVSAHSLRLSKHTGREHGIRAEFKNFDGRPAFS